MKGLLDETNSCSYFQLTKRDMTLPATGGYEG